VKARKHETGRCEMPVTRPLKVNDARCIALFASGLQPSNAPTVGGPRRDPERRQPRPAGRG
jgi:hypothetical protein